jgi:NAD(P)H-dependent FMN reductase
MITIISGTNRANNNSIKVSTHVADVYRRMGEAVEVLDLQKLPPEAFLPEVYAEKPASLTGPFTEKVLSADGLVVVVPEYNGSFPGILKHFIDLLPFPQSFNCRPVAFIGLAAGYHGALRPVEQLQMVFAYRNAHLFNRRVFIPSVHKALAGDGSIQDEDLVRRLDEQAQHYVKFIQSLKAIQ